MFENGVAARTSPQAQMILGHFVVVFRVGGKLNQTLKFRVLAVFFPPVGRADHPPTPNCLPGGAVPPEQPIQPCGRLAEPLFEEECSSPEGASSSAPSPRRSELGGDDQSSASSSSEAAPSPPQGQWRSFVIVAVCPLSRMNTDMTKSTEKFLFRQFAEN